MATDMVGPYVTALDQLDELRAHDRVSENEYAVRRAEVLASAGRPQPTFWTKFLTGWAVIAALLVSAWVLIKFFTLFL